MRAFSLILLAALLNGREPPMQHVFRVDVEAVQLDVFVGSKGEAVLGLKAHDFQIYDNGVLQKTEIAEPEAVPMGAVIVLDASQSVQGDKLDQLKIAARVFLERLGKADQAALVCFSSFLQRGRGRFGDKEALYRNLETIKASGSTSLFDGLYAGLKLAERFPRPVVLLFTDGRDTSSWLTDLEVLDVAKQSRAIVYVISAPSNETEDTIDITGRRHRRHNPDVRFLQEIAALTGGRFLSASSLPELQKIFRGILSESKTRYLLSYVPEGVEPGGWHRIEVKCEGRDLQITARRGYWRRHPDE